MNRKGFCPDCGCRVRDPFPRDPDFFAICVDCGLLALARAEVKALKKALEEKANGDR